MVLWDQSIAFLSRKDNNATGSTCINYDTERRHTEGSWPNTSISHTTLNNSEGTRGHEESTETRHDSVASQISSIFPEPHQPNQNRPNNTLICQTGFDSDLSGDTAEARQNFGVSVTSSIFSEPYLPNTNRQINNQQCDDPLKVGEGIEMRQLSGVSQVSSIFPEPYQPDLSREQNYPTGHGPMWEGQRTETRQMPGVSQHASF